MIFGVYYSVKTGQTLWWQKPAADAQAAGYSIPSGSTLSDVAGGLKMEGYIDNENLFKLYGRFSGKSKTIHAGVFTLKPGDNYRNILATLQLPSDQEATVTIPEGLTVEQTGDIVRLNVSITPEEWDKAVKGKEGYLFPNTYRFYVNATAEDVVGVMRKEFDKQMKAAGINPTKEQIIIASIIQREVQKPEDMKMVSDIIRKRLKIGMALQMDSTVNYVTGKSDPAVSLEDTAVKSKYNTYKNPGLPPGPISNPGIDAIKATLSPTSNSYFYFLTTPAGEVKYAATNEEHSANKWKFLK